MLVRAFIIFLSFGLFYSCSAKKSDLKYVKSNLDPKLETGIGVEILYSEKGKVQVQINASKVLRYSDDKAPYTEMPEGLNIIFYNDYGQAVNFLKGDYGKNEESKELMYAQGNVCLSNIKDEFLYAEELYWNQKTKKVYSEKFVKIETPDEVIYGEGFESDEEFTSYVIKKIKGSVSTDKLKSKDLEKK